MGRSRGGLTTKIHAVVDACGLPIMLKLTEGQAHDGRSAQDMLGTIGRGDVLVADRAYDSNALRETLAARGARATAGMTEPKVTHTICGPRRPRSGSSSNARATIAVAMTQPAL